jgi:hypothetical protein
MAKGNPKAYLNANKGANSPIINPKFEITDDENARMIQLCMDTFNHPIPDINNPTEVIDTINAYFQTCIDKGLRPGNLGLYAWLGLDRKDVNHILAGRKKINAACVDIIKKAVKTLSTYRESLGSSGKLNPITLLFWQKNFDHMEDKQQIEVSARDTSTADQTPEEIAAALEADVIQDN